MSASKPSASTLWQTAERMLDEDEEDDRLAGLSDEDFLRAMSDAPKPARTPTLDKTMADVNARIQARRAPVDPVTETWTVPSDAPRHTPIPRIVWLMAAAFALVLGALGVVKRNEIVAFLRNDKAHDDKNAPRDQPAPPEDRAAAARAQATQACGQGAVDVCEERLDEARKLDPAGESSPEVVRMREVIDQARKPPPEAKPQWPKSP